MKSWRNNERRDGLSLEKIDSAFVVFGANSEFDIPSEERKLLQQKVLKRISDYVYNNLGGESQGLPYCVKHYGNYIFVGFSQGVIRIFDITTNEELKSLVPKKGKLFSNRVTCMDVSLSGNQLVAGYTSGKICLFDIFKAKIIIEVDEIFFMDVASIKFLSGLSSNNVIAADKRGLVLKILFSKKLIKYSSKSVKIMERPLPDICTIAALQPREGMPYEVIEWEDLNITAISNTEQIVIYCLGNEINLLYGVSRSEFGKGFIKSDSICYLDWGYGITPTVSRERSKCLLAIGWDKLLQI